MVWYAAVIFLVFISSSVNEHIQWNSWEKCKRSRGGGFALCLREFAIMSTHIFFYRNLAITRCIEQTVGGNQTIETKN